MRTVLAAMLQRVRPTWTELMQTETAMAEVMLELMPRLDSWGGLK